MACIVNTHILRIEPKDITLYALDNFIVNKIIFRIIARIKYIYIYILSIASQIQYKSGGSQLRINMGILFHKNRFLKRQWE